MSIPYRDKPVKGIVSKTHIPTLFEPVLPSLDSPFEAVKGASSSVIEADPNI